MNMVKQLLQFALKFVIFNLLKGTFLMKFKDGKTISAYVRSNLHSGYVKPIILIKPILKINKQFCIQTSTIYNIPGVLLTKLTNAVYFYYP